VAAGGLVPAVAARFNTVLAQESAEEDGIKHPLDGEFVFVLSLISKVADSHVQLQVSKVVRSVSSSACLKTMAAYPIQWPMLNGLLLFAVPYQSLECIIHSCKPDRMSCSSDPEIWQGNQPNMECG